MISDTQMRYGSRVPCHGRSWRPCTRCHATTRVRERARRARRRWRQRIPSRCFAFMAASDCGYFAISSSSVRRGAGAVAHLGLRGRDVEERVGHLRAVRPQLDQLPLRRDRGAIVLARELRVADPVLRRRCERAARVGLDERLEAGDGAGVVAALELVERAVVGTLLAGGRGRPAARPAAAVGGTAGAIAAASAGAAGLAASAAAAAGRRLQLAHARIEVDVEILLPLLRLAELVGQHLDLAAQLREVAAHALDLVAAGRGPGS